MLSKDFNICLTCFREERYYLRYDMDRKGAICIIPARGRKKKEQKRLQVPLGNLLRFQALQNMQLLMSPQVPAPSALF